METRIASVTEEPAEDGVPVLRHPGWCARWPWLVQGITTAGGRGDWDLALFGGSRAGAVMERWEVLLQTLAVPSAVHSRQVHGAAIHLHPPSAPGLHVATAADGHVSAEPGLLLTVSVADCVPVYLVAPRARAVAVVHAGWRGAAAGILEQALDIFHERLGLGAPELHAHMGPAICGSCYEVGPEVHQALGEPVPPAPAPVDLAANLARRAVAAGVKPASVSRSTFCTRCGTAPLFSHRAGDAGRQMAFIAVAARE